LKHMILAKFKPEVANKAALLEPIRVLFSAADQIPGVRGAAVYPCCVQRNNRYDVLIVLDMDREALPMYDDSEMHHAWKARYGSLLEKKAIFDCDM